MLRLALLFLIPALFVGCRSSTSTSATASGGSLARPSASAATATEILAPDLPPEGRTTLSLIHAGGPFPFPKDGSTFGNFEHRLPEHARGYYHEYTVPTPGAKTRGARRIIAGEGATHDVRTSGEYWYTGDHYETFRRIRE